MTFLRFFIRKPSDDTCMPLAWHVSSTSSSGGNQVDGLPPASSNTETIAKLARLGPAKNGTTLTGFGRDIKVLMDDLMKSAQKTLSSVY